jgi:cell division protein FtsB
MKNNIIARLKEENVSLNSGTKPTHSVDDLLTRIATLEGELESITDRHEELERSQKTYKDKVNIYTEENSELAAKIKATA